MDELEFQDPNIESAEVVWATCECRAPHPVLSVNILIEGIGGAEVIFSKEELEAALAAVKSAEEEGE